MPLNQEKAEVAQWSASRNKQEFPKITFQIL
jgi:hypothetical protein